MKRVRVILSEEAVEACNYLNEHSSESKIDRSILNSINKKAELIKANPHYGDPISRKLIPQEYVEIRSNESISSGVIELLENVIYTNRW